MAYDQASPGLGCDLWDCMQAAGWLGDDGSARPGLPALTVLAVDLDLEAVAALTAARMEVSLVQDALRGLDLLRGGAAPDVILTDIAMPRPEGLDFIRAVRRMEHLRATPLLILTAETAPELKARARAAGAAGWLTRPCDAHKLVRSIHTVTC